MDNDLAVSSVLSGNRNVEGRIHPLTKANYLAAPPLVVAYALAGTVDIGLANESLGQDKDADDIYLIDIWPPMDEIKEQDEKGVNTQTFRSEYDNLIQSNER